MLGGLQKELYRNEKAFFSFDQQKISLHQVKSVGMSLASFNGLNPYGEEFFGLIPYAKDVLLSLTNIGKADIYIKDLYEALKGTKFEFKTSSPMKNNDGQINGFLRRDNNILSLFANADNRIILSFEAFDLGERKHG